MLLLLQPAMVATANRAEPRYARVHMLCSTLLFTTEEAVNNVDGSFVVDVFIHEIYRFIDTICIARIAAETSQR